MSIKGLADFLESSYTREMTTPTRISLPGRSRNSSSKSRRQSFRRLYTVSTELEEPEPKRQRLSVASTNATLGNGSSLEESLSILEKTPDKASPLIKTARQLQLTGMTRHLSASEMQNCTSGVSYANLNKASKNNCDVAKTANCSKDYGNCDSSPDIDLKTLRTKIHNFTPNRVLSSTKSAVTPMLSAHKTPKSTPGSNYNDSPLSVKMLRSKHEALNALHNIMFAKTTSPQVSGIRKLQHAGEEGAKDRDSNGEQKVHDDLPKTQPATTVLMQGVIAFVDVRNGGDNRSEGVKSHLMDLGATVLDKFTKEVTHVIFMDGLMSTYKKAVQRKIPLVSVLWIEACKKAMERVPESLYPPHQMEKYHSPDPLKKFRREKSFQPEPHENIEDWLEKCKLKRRKKKSTIEEKENEEIPLPEVLRNRPAWLDGNLEHALRSIADVGPEYEEYLNRSTSPTLSEEESFDTPLAVRLLRQIRRAKDINPQNAMTKKSLDLGTPKDTICTESNEPEVSKTEVLSVSLETPRKLSRVPIARKSMYFSNKDASYENECEPPSTSPKAKMNLFEAIQLCVKEQATSNSLAADSSKGSGAERAETKSELVSHLKQTAKQSLKSKSESVYGHGQNTTKQSNEVIAMELTPIVENKQVAVSESSASTATKLPCDISTCSVTGSRPQTLTKRRLMPLTQPEVLQGDISEKIAPPLCPYNLDSPKNRKRKREKSLEGTKVSRRQNFTVSSKNKVTKSRNSLADFVMDLNKSKKKQPNMVASLPTMVGTGLHTPELELIAAVIEKLGGFTLAPNVVSSTTHVIIPGPRRTVNLLKGMVRGCWIVTQGWVLSSLEAGHWIDEEPFELTEFSPVVKENRVARLSFGPRFKINIFKECGAIYVSRSSKPPKADLEDLITLCGGQVVQTIHHALLVLGKALQRKNVCCVKEIWVLDCITANELKPLDGYLLSATV